jgi:hypothetical protein
MNSLMFGCLACLAAFPLFPARAAEGTVPLDVELKVTDQDYHPLAGVPVRLVFGGPDWQAPDAGVKVVTPDDGIVKFTAPAVIDRRWSSVNIGFTPLREPVRVDHLSLAAELIFTMPKREGGDVDHRLLYTAYIERLSDGDCFTEDLDKVYEAGPDGRFTKLVGSNAAGPNFDGMIDGWKLAGGAGYRIWNSMLAPVEDSSADKSAPKRWTLQLGLMRKPKPVIR